MRRDHARAAPRAFELAQLAREHGLTMYGAFGAFLESWATDAGGAPGDGLWDMRRAVDELRGQNVLLFDGLLKIALAEAEARAGDPDRAVALANGVTRDCGTNRLLRVRSRTARAAENPAKRWTPANSAPAGSFPDRYRRREAARAVLAARGASLACSITMVTRKRAVLASALEGFAPTDEMLRSP